MRFLVRMMMSSSVCCDSRLLRQTRTAERHFPIVTALQQWNSTMIKAWPSVEFQADDAASLRAALAMFDDWDSDLTALFELGHDASTSYGRQPKQTKTAETAAPYKPRRDARKLEIAALRAQVEELEAVVAVEKAIVKASPPAGESFEIVALRNEWERIAINQHEQRLATDVDNAKLRELVQSQVKTSQKILQLTKRVMQLEDVLPTHPVTSFENYSGPKVDLQSQLDRLDAMLPRSAGLFTSGAFAEQAHNSFQEVQFRQNEPGVRGVGVQYEASWLLPFDIERVADALWIQTIRAKFKHKTAAFMDIHEDANCLVSKFISTPIAKNMLGASQGQIASRRLPRDLGDGSFLILVTGKVHTYKESEMQGSADVQGWLRIESVSSRTAEPLTRIQWHRQTLIQPPDVETIAPKRLSKWIHAVIAGPTRTRFERDLEWSVQAIENMLVCERPQNDSINA